MPAQSPSEFAAIQVVGEIMQTDYLKTITSRKAPQQAALDYGLPKSRSFAEEHLRFWSTANTVYPSNRSRHVRRRTAESRFVDFLYYVLGYDDIESVDGRELDGRTFALSHLACGGAFPMLLVSREYSLDRPEARFSSNGSRMTPHRVVQEYLNADRDALWGMVSNGSQVRILRDNPSMTRPAYLEADLEQVFSEDLYAEFRTFWLMAHASRFRPATRDPSTCIFEDWRSLAHEHGEKANEKLRIGVSNALGHLGTGFLAHPQNKALREAVQSGEVTADSLFAELLRLIYRFLFLFTAEERNLLHRPDANDSARAIYKEAFSLNQLRERARYRRHYDQYSDLWKRLLIVFGALTRGAPDIGLPALGGLFRSDQCQHLDQATIANSFLLNAVSDLGYLRTGQSLTRVNYADMGIEELGSIYESLLELHPSIDVSSGTWKFTLDGIGAGPESKGSKRKSTGSYYTPQSLVQELVKSALDPVIGKAIASRPDNPRAAILDLRVIDPACGSGHFLLAAANRLAAELVRLESDIEELGTQRFQHALREVLQNCIFGVDKNWLAVELCRVTLWMAALEPGKPLTFLENHIRLGDSLIGVLSGEDMADGIPNDAYIPLTGDSKPLCSELKSANKHSRKATGSVFDQPREVALANAQLEFHFMREDSPAEIDRKRKAWQANQAAMAKDASRLQADLFVSAFVSVKAPDNRTSVPVSGDLSKIHWPCMSPEMEANRQKLRRQFKYFHWHVQFADVMASGGFDVVFANPPWERFKIQEKEFFAVRYPKIAAAPNKAQRDKLIQALNSESSNAAEMALFRDFQMAKRKSEAITHFARKSGRFPLTGRGDLNSYPLFAELCLQLLKPTGRAGLVVPTGIATDSSTKKFFGSIVNENRLVSLFDFENREKVFRGVHSSYKFCLLTLAGKSRDEHASEYAFYLRQPHQLKEAERRFFMAREDFALFNPNTRTCPTFRTGRDVEIARKMYKKSGILWKERRGFEPEDNPWGIRFSSMFHMSGDSGLFRTRGQLEEEGWTLAGNIFTKAGNRYLPLYEAKLFHQYDHRFATFDGEKAPKTREMTSGEKADPDTGVLPRYWVPEKEVLVRTREGGGAKIVPNGSNQSPRRVGWHLALRRFARSTDQRTVLMGILMQTGMGDSGVVVDFGWSYSEISQMLPIFERR